MAAGLKADTAGTAGASRDRSPRPHLLGILPTLASQSCAAERWVGALDGGGGEQPAQRRLTKRGNHPRRLPQGSGQRLRQCWALRCRLRSVWVAAGSPSETPAVGGGLNWRGCSMSGWERAGRRVLRAGSWGRSSRSEGFSFPQKWKRFEEHGDERLRRGEAAPAPPARCLDTNTAASPLSPRPFSPSLCQHQPVNYPGLSSCWLLSIWIRRSQIICMFKGRR